MRCVALHVAFITAAAPLHLAAQQPTDAQLTAARAFLAAGQLDSADVLLRATLDNAPLPSDSVTVFVWRAILEFMRGDERATRAAFHEALVLDTALDVPGLVSPRLRALLDVEREVLTGQDFVFASADVDDPPRRLSGPPVSFPPELLRRRVGGQALVGGIVDTLGQIEASSIEIRVVPDTGFNEPLRRMLLASTFAPGRIRERPVRTITQLAIELTPGTPPNATAYISSARAELAAHRADSALRLLRLARDPATHPTEGEQVYALLVEGIAWQALHQDAKAGAVFDTALAGYRHLEERGVELAPFLRRLGDSVGAVRTPGPKPDPLGRPVALDSVDISPVLVSHPPIVYPPELQALRVGGTVTVEATVDSTGRVVPASVRLLQSPNPGLDAEAKRVVAGSRYRPARRGGRNVPSRIRQAITFKPY